MNLNRFSAWAFCTGINFFGHIALADTAWTYEIPSRPHASGPVQETFYIGTPSLLKNSSVVAFREEVVTQRGTAKTIRAFECSTFGDVDATNQLWNVPDEGPSYNPINVTNNHMIVDTYQEPGSLCSGLQSYDVSGLRPVRGWRYSVTSDGVRCRQGREVHREVAGNTLVLAYQTDVPSGVFVVVLDTNTGQEIWSKQLGKVTYAFANVPFVVPAGTDGSVYIGIIDDVDISQANLFLYDSNGNGALIANLGNRQIAAAYRLSDNSLLINDYDYVKIFRRDGHLSSSVKQTVGRDYLIHEDSQGLLYFRNMMLPNERIRAYDRITNNFVWTVNLPYSEQYYSDDYGRKALFDEQQRTIIVDTGAGLAQLGADDGQLRQIVSTREISVRRFTNSTSFAPARCADGGVIVSTIFYPHEAYSASKMRRFDGF
jgi:hypothetical protein